MADRYVWFVSQGSYSDYTVLAAFTSEEGARRYLGGVPDWADDARVERCPLDEFDPEIFGTEEID